MMKASTTNHQSRRWRGGLDLVGRTLWYLPGRFRIAQQLGLRYSLRCVLFHDVAASETAFTKGLGITITPDHFESALKFLTRHYTPVCLQDVLAESDGHRLPSRPVLVTFDDAYASVREVAAPLCKKYGVPAIFFVNAACLDNRQLALDNLVCYTANVIGMGGINVAAVRAGAPEGTEFSSLAEVFGRFLPAISLTTREAFRAALIELLETEEPELAAQARLYLTNAQLRDLASFGFEIGNHTYTHVSCRSLTRSDLEGEIDRNKRELEALSGEDVRSFSVPYGCSEDLPAELVVHLQRTGHKAAFLVESVANQLHADCFRLNRVTVRVEKDAALFSEIEILPRFRAIRNWLSRDSSPSDGRQVSHLEPAS